VANTTDSSIAGLCASRRPSPLERAFDALPPRLGDDADVGTAFRLLLATLRESTAGSERLYATAGEGFFSDGGLFSLPRLVYFGARGSPGALRLAFFAGWNGRELRGSLALLAFVHHLMIHPEVADGCNLLFHPLVNVTGFLDGTAHTRLGHDLEHAAWTGTSAPPELRSIAADFPRHAAHGWIEILIEPVADRIQARVRGLPVHPDYLPIDLPQAGIDWSPAQRGEPVDTPSGGLAALSRGAFGLSFGIPGGWPPSRYIPQLVRVLGATIDRYRRAAAFGGEL